MKKISKLLVLLTALAMVVCLCAGCGETANNGGNDGDNGGGNQAASVKGSTGEWGYYKVLVPEGYTLKGGNILDETDKSKFNLNNNDSALTYFMFSLYDEENAKDSIDMTRDMNDGAKDVTGTYNGVAWTGVAYESIGYQCFSMYGDFGDGHFVLVSAAGNAYDSEITNAVLSSLVVNVTE